jgi:UDP-N-acetylglucosamine 3-dehydrogenase
MGSMHMRVLSQINGVDVVASVDPRRERHEWMRRAYPLTAVFATLEQALERTERVDFAVVAVPAPDLYEIGMAVLGANLPVLVEKPLAGCERDGRALVEEAESRGLLLGVGHVERCNPAVIALKQRLDAGAIGRIYQIYARRLSPFPARDSMLGVSLDLATHDIDVMRYLIGAEVDSVFAESARRLHDSAEDLIAATLRFADSTIGLLEVNWLTPAKVRELVVTGEGGAFVVNYLSQELRFFSHPTEATKRDVLGSMRGAGEGDMVRYALQRHEPLQVEWESFLKAMEGADTPLASGRDGYAALSTACAIQQSGVSREAVAPSYRMAGAARSADMVS